jgi:hypothetical protein
MLMEKEFKLVIVGIFKNEAHIMQEWLTHYLNQGVEHFYLIDNGSTDNWQSEIEGFPVTIKSDSEKNAQYKLYNKYFLEVVKKKSEWMMVVDLDEFLYARNKFKSIPEYLKSLDKEITSVRVPWKIFGSNGHEKQPDGVVSNFTKTNGAYKSQVKSITKTDVIHSIAVHFYTVRSNKMSIGVNWIRETDNLQLNHYICQSWEWFSKIKMTRGDVAKEKYENMRSWKYFRKYDFNQIEDTELKDINKNLS